MTKRLRISANYNQNVCILMSLKDKSLSIINNNTWLNNQLSVSSNKNECVH